MWCDAQRRLVERCDVPRRAALPTVMSISPTRLIDQPDMAGREATSRQCCCRKSPSLSISPKKPPLLERDVTKPVAVGFGAHDGRTVTTTVERDDGRRITRKDRRCD
jgi:hypothetical protein